MNKYSFLEIIIPFEKEEGFEYSLEEMYNIGKISYLMVQKDMII